MSLCQNCKKEFPAERLQLHEVFCLKYLRQCLDCSEFVDVRHMAEHVEQHSRQNPTREEAKQACQECSFCKLEVPVADMAAHLEACSSRTQHCAVCNSFIQLKHLASHRCQPIERQVSPEVLYRPAEVVRPIQQAVRMVDLAIRPVDPSVRSATDLARQAARHGTRLQPAQAGTHAQPRPQRQRLTQNLQNFWRQKDDTFMRHKAPTYSMTVRPPAVVFPGDLIPVTSAFVKLAKEQ